MGNEIYVALFGQWCFGRLLVCCRIVLVRKIYLPFCKCCGLLLDVRKVMGDGCCMRGVGEGVKHE